MINTCFIELSLGIRYFLIRKMKINEMGMQSGGKIDLSKQVTAS